MITINNSKNPPNWVIALLLIMLGLLILALYKGCQNYNRNETKEIDAKGRIEKLLKDSTRTQNELQELRNEKDVIDGQLDISNNQRIAYIDSFRLLNDHINALRKRYKAIEPPAEDTSLTLVPGAYIADCSDCFTSIEKAQELGIKLKAQLDNADYLNKSKMNVLNNTISLLEMKNTQLRKDYKSLIDSTSNKKSELRRTLFLSLGAMAINQTFPNAIGAGFLYEDKKRRVYGAKYYISSHGPIYQADFSLPLSLKF